MTWSAKHNSIIVAQSIIPFDLEVKSDKACGIRAIRYCGVVCDCSTVCFKAHFRFVTLLQSKVNLEQT